MNKRTQGSQAEEIAAKCLVREGYQIIERNFTIKGGELDIIAKDNDYYVFVEVKSLKNEEYLRLEQTISKKKQKSLLKSAQIWLNKMQLQNIDYRIDFFGIIIEKSGKIKRILHIKNAITEEELG